MKRCPDKTEWVLYAAEEVSEGRRGDLEAHLEACEACRRDVSALRRGLRALTALARESPVRPEGLEVLKRHLRVAAAHRASPRRSRASPRRSRAGEPRILVAVWRYRWVAAAAAIVLAATLWTLWPAGQPVRTAQDADLSDAIAEITVAVEILETDQYAGTTPNGSSRLEKGPNLPAAAGDAANGLKTLPADLCRLSTGRPVTGQVNVDGRREPCDPLV
jgi:anti-sigma factor RsiW